MEKIHIEENTVQATLVIPLYARKQCTERFPDLFQDPKASELIDRIDYDFTQIEKKSNRLMQKFGALEVAMRQSDMAIEIAQYLKEHPKAAVVNLGCGLDQTAENCDNGLCKIYNLDYPDVIEIRNQLLPGNDRIKNIPADLNDIRWFEKIDAQNGAVFFAGGVFYYFKKEQVKKLFNAMARSFKGGKLVFDIAGKRAVNMMIKTWVRQAGMKDVNAFFYVNDINKDILPWIENMKVSSRGYMLGYHSLKNPSVPALFRLFSKIGDEQMHMQIVRLDFI